MLKTCPRNYDSDDGLMDDDDGDSLVAEQEPPDAVVEPRRSKRARRDILYDVSKGSNIE